MALDQTTIQQFQFHTAQIQAANPLNQPAIAHNFQRWQTELAGSAAAAPLAAVLQFLGGNLNITRQKLFDAVVQGVDIQARFLMQMLWGYPPIDNRAQSRVLDYFQSSQIANAKNYKTVTDAIGRGDFKTAFALLNGVSGLSTSYVTKVLYFEGQRRNVAENKYPIIMDDRVSEGMLKITSPWAHACVTCSAPRPMLTSTAGARRIQNQIDLAWDKYWAYVEGCHEISGKLNTHADHVEYFLFNY